MIEYMYLIGSKSVQMATESEMSPKSTESDAVLLTGHYRRGP